MANGLCFYLQFKIVNLKFEINEPIFCVKLFKQTLLLRNILVRKIRKNRKSRFELKKKRKLFHEMIRARNFKTF